MTRRDFLLFAFILLLIVGTSGGAVYFWQQSSLLIREQQERPELERTKLELEAAPQEKKKIPVETPEGWKTYQGEDGIFEFSYPADILTLEKSPGSVNLSHSLPYKTERWCFFSPHPVERIFDFDLELKVIENTREALEGEFPSYFPEEFFNFENNKWKQQTEHIDKLNIAAVIEVSFGRLHGIVINWISQGFGSFKYFFPLENETILVAEQEVHDYCDWEEYISRVPGAISEEERQNLLEGIISSFQIIE